MAEARTEYDPVLGVSSLASFGAVGQGELVTLPGNHLREGLLASLWTAELLAAQQGIVPWIEIPGSGRGVAVLGAARAKIDQAPESVRTIYLAAHGAARSAQAHARAVGRAESVPVQVGDFGASLIVLTVIGVAAVCATAWFARGAIVQMVTTHGEDVRATYAADTAAKLAMAQIAAGQTVDPSVWKTLGAVASREQRDSMLAPGLLIGGAAVAAGLVGWTVWKGARHVL